MNNEDRVDLMLAYGMQLAGTPYRWGGNTPIFGLDCSGLVLELLRAVGFWGAQDASALALHKALRAKGCQTKRPEPGGVVFFGHTRETINHVAVCMSDALMIEAGGGGQDTTSLDAADRAGAFVRIRPISRRPDIADCLLPWEKTVAQA
jgi:cell wall-associated NlpC family hydrolase